MSPAWRGGSLDGLGMALAIGLSMTTDRIESPTEILQGAAIEASEAGDRFTMYRCLDAATATGVHGTPVAVVAANLMIGNHAKLVALAERIIAADILGA
jgi:hypothetical protein